jgi:uncharacterized membrane protein YphA (DoxX/SURF4 family)
MHVTIAALSIAAALVFLLAGGMKVAMRPGVAKNLRRLGVDSGGIRMIGILEIAGAIGLLAGVWMPPLRVAAAAGFVCLLIGALTYHARAGDFGDRRTRAEALAPGVLLAVTAAIGALSLDLH